MHTEPRSKTSRIGDVLRDVQRAQIRQINQDEKRQTITRAPRNGLQPSFIRADHAKHGRFGIGATIKNGPIRTAARRGGLL